MHTTIRRAREADLDAVADLFDRYRQFYDQAPDIARARAFIQQRWVRGESVVLVAQNAQGGLDGFCQLYPSFCSVEAMPIYVLYDLFVAPTARRGGTGRLLLQAAHAQAAADGKVRMDLTTARTNHAAQGLYASLGWTLDEVFLAYSRRVAPLSGADGPPA